MNDSGDRLDALDAFDQRLLDEVREVYARVDPVPAGLTDRIKFALTVQALNADVAELIAGGPVGVRADGVDAPSLTGTITFTTPTRSLVVSASEAGDGWRRVDGWVTGGPASVEVHSSGGDEPVRRVFADENGRFVFDRVRPGAVYFVIRREPDDPDERPVLTPTFVL